MSLDEQLRTAAGDLRLASRLDSDPESMLRDLKQAHTRRRATGGAMIVLILIAALALGTIAWTSNGGDRTLPGTTPTPTPMDSEKSAPALAGCNLDCEWSHSGSGFVATGAIKAGTYKTTWFYPGQLTMTFPDGWSILQDTTGDLNIRTDADPDASVALWLDVTPIAGHRVPQDDVVRSPEGIVDWLGRNPDVTATPRGTLPIGTSGDSPVVASVVDIVVSKSAKNYGGANCPTSACVYLFAMDPQWMANEPSDGPGETDSGWAIGRDQSNVRLYVAFVGPAGHLLYVVLDAPTPERLEALSTSFAPILASLQLPAAIP